MLKIKDNVDLKELKKYGFKYTPNCYDNYKLCLQNDLEGAIYIKITKNRIVYPVVDLDVYNLSNKNEFQIHDILYDLIKADLVEKVDVNERIKKVNI